GDFEAAADLMEAAIPALQRRRGEAILRGWAHELPPDLVRTRPVLGIGLVGGLASYGEFDSIAERLRDIEAALAEIEKGSADSRVVVVDAAQLPRIPGAVALYRAALAQVRGDLPALIDQATRVLELAPAD